MRLSQMKSRAHALAEKINRHTRQPVAVVVNTGDANSYGMVLNLGRSGVPVLAVSSDPSNITFTSRYSKALLCPDHRDSEQTFIEFLLFLGEALRKKPVLFVNGDEQLMLLLRRRSQIARLFYLPYASYETAQRLVDKVAFYRLLSEIEAPHATTHLPCNSAEMAEIAPRLEYPYILKPAQSMTFSERFGNKCLCVDNAEEARARFAEIACVEDRVIVQKQLLGAERYLVYTYFSSDSQPVGICCYRKIRIYPTDFGNACICETVHEAEAIRLCLDVLQRIGYCGLAEAEIQRDAADGQLKLVEINARSTTEDRLSAHCGVNMELIAYRDLLGLWQHTECLVNKRMGVLWIDLFRDLLSVFAADGYRAMGELTARQWWISLRGKQRVFAFCALDDPVPALRHWLKLFHIYGLKTKRLRAALSAFWSFTSKKLPADSAE